jgi:hypothetical protein
MVYPCHPSPSPSSPPRYSPTNAATGGIAGKSPCGVAPAAEILDPHGGAAAAPALAIYDHLQATEAAWGHLWSDGVGSGVGQEGPILPRWAWPGMYWTLTTSRLAARGAPGVVLHHDISMVVVVSSFAGGDQLVCG